MNKYNSEGYPDPTAYYGTKEIVREESEQERRIRHLMHIIREAAHLAGLERIMLIFGTQSKDTEYAREAEVQRNQRPQP